MSFEIVEARPWMCGRMARMLRSEHQQAALRIGLDPHRQLRATFDQSTSFRRAWLIDGLLAGLGGVTGTLLSPVGFVWLALTDRATRYPVAAVREARRQLDEIMLTKTALRTNVLGGDDGAGRFLAFLGFEVDRSMMGEAAYTRYGRRRLNEYIREEEDIRVPFGANYVVPMTYQTGAT